MGTRYKITVNGKLVYEGEFTSSKTEITETLKKVEDLLNLDENTPQTDDDLVLFAVES